MKITKRQLKRIIKEEKAKLLEQSRLVFPDGTLDPALQGSDSGQGMPGSDEWYDAINDLIYSELGASGGDMSTDGRSIIEALENLRRDIQDELGVGPLPMGVE